MDTEVSVEKELTVQRTGTAVFSTIALILLAGLMLAIGVLNLMIYGDCNATDKSTATINYYAAIFGAGLGAGVLAYLLLGWMFTWSAWIPLILLTLLIITLSSFNLYYFNSDLEMAGQALNTGLIGVGVGLALGFILSFIESVPEILKLQILGLLLAVSVVVFTIFGVNTYQKCHQPAAAKSDLIALAVMLAIGLLLLIGIIASFFL